MTNRQAKIIGLGAILGGALIAAQIGLLVMASDGGSRRFEWGSNIAMGVSFFAGLLFLFEYFRPGE